MSSSKCQGTDRPKVQNALCSLCVSLRQRTWTADLRAQDNERMTVPTRYCALAGPNASLASLSRSKLVMT